MQYINIITKKLISYLAIPTAILISSFWLIPEQQPTIFFIGDSTVRCGRNADGYDGLWGWGSTLKFYFDTAKVKVENKALGGTSSRTYQTKGLWKNVSDKIQPGDYVLMQFGHNDGGPFATGRARASIEGIGEDTLNIILEATGEPEVVHSYGWYMRKYIRDTREKGGIPILVTPIPRNDWDENGVLMESKGYPEWIREIAASENVLIIDLNKLMTNALNELGQNAVTGKYFFAHDHTHTTIDGSKLNASLLVRAIRELENCNLKDYLLDSEPEFELPPMQYEVLRYDFGGKDAAIGYQIVDEQAIYTEQTGYGFDYGTKPVSVDHNIGSNLWKDYCTSDKPFYFSVKLPEGNYKVTLWIGDKEGESITTVKTESRRLSVDRIKTEKGTIVKEVIYVNVRSPKINDSLTINLKDRELPYLNWDDKLTLEFSDSLPCISGIEIEPVLGHPTVVYLAGNSTVTDQNYEPWASWGQMIPAFLTKRVIVANYAASGASLSSFYHRKRLEKILSLIKKNDYLFIEFGHNDQKIKGEENGAYGSYSDFLRTYIDKTREKGATPVLVTPVRRRKFDDKGNLENTLGDFPDAMRKVATEKNVPLIDLNEISKDLYTKWGVEASKNAFCHYPANTFTNQPQALADNTHFNSYGAYTIALCVINGIIDSDLELKNQIKQKYKEFDHMIPIPFEKWYLPQSLFVENQKPLGS